MLITPRGREALAAARRQRNEFVHQNEMTFATLSAVAGETSDQLTDRLLDPREELRIAAVVEGAHVADMIDDAVDDEAIVADGCHDALVETVEVGGQRFEYELVGQGVPVVAVQNVQAPLRMWPTPGETSALHDAGFALLAYRHLGSSDTITEIAADVGRLIDHLGVGPVCLWGYSQGAMTAQELALARPDIVRSAVMMATRGRLTAYDRFRYEAVEPYLDDSDPGMLLSMLMNFGLDALCDDEVFEKALASQRSVGDLLDDTLRERANHAGATYGIGRLDALRAVHVPCMVVAFAQDGNIPPVLNREVADAIPGCEYVEIAGAGHRGGVSHRREVRDHVVPFLRRTAGLATASGG